jgi:cysteine desulfurase
MRLPIYLDYAATTPVDPRVADRLGRHLTRDGVFGNPSSDTHSFGRTAARAVETAREQVAALLNALPREIVWTSAPPRPTIWLSVAPCARARQGRHLVTDKTEHKAVLDVCRRLEREGCSVTYLDPGPMGLIELEQLAEALRPDTVLVSLMHVNNETGVAQDLAAIGALTRARGICCTSTPLRASENSRSTCKRCPSICSVSAPTSCTVPRVSARCSSGSAQTGCGWNRCLYGGGQERGLRAGTLPVHQIVAMGEACRIAGLEMEDEHPPPAIARPIVAWAGRVGRCVVERPSRAALAGHLNVSFAGIAAEALLAAIPEIASPPVPPARPPATNPRMCCEPWAAMPFGREARSDSVWAASPRSRRSITPPRRLSAAVNRLRDLSPLWEDGGGLDWTQSTGKRHHRVARKAAPSHQLS